MLPKVIHYCWFGGNPLPKNAELCIESWKRFFPDYEIKRWDEENFDINICAYTREAAIEKKWAFVSDFARINILYNEGGIYFDTDVEVIKNMDDIINEGPYVGLEENSGINMGLGCAFEPHNPLLLELINLYKKRSFYKKDGTIDDKTIVEVVSTVFEEKGWIPKNKIQKIMGVTIYTTDFFCPMNYHTRELNILDTTYTIHHYDASWFDDRAKKRAMQYRKIYKYFKIFPFCLADVITRFLVIITLEGPFALMKKLLLLLRR